MQPGLRFTAIANMLGAVFVDSAACFATCLYPATRVAIPSLMTMRRESSRCRRTHA
jgi:hypothetical protein